MYNYIIFGKPARPYHSIYHIMKILCASLKVHEHMHKNCVGLIVRRSLWWNVEVTGVTSHIGVARNFDWRGYRTQAPYRCRNRYALRHFPYVMSFQYIWYKQFYRDQIRMNFIPKLNFDIFLWGKTAKHSRVLSLLWCPLKRRGPTWSCGGWSVLT